MNIIEQIKEYARLYPSRIAITDGNCALTYSQLHEYSEGLSLWIARHNQNPGIPIPVYGHKNPWTIVCFLGCVKAGCAYTPIDISVPEGRVASILEALPSHLVLSTEELTMVLPDKDVLSLSEIQEIAAIPGTSDSACWVKGSETYYIIFTSGSTGTPKGVQITADCLNHFLDWSITLSQTNAEAHAVYLNQAPFSFDLSVMDLYTSLATGGTLYCLSKKVQGDYPSLMKALGESGTTVWVSTPSFADLCLSESQYRKELLPELRCFLFCGEILGNRTVKKLMERFPKARIYNTYGPTESTVAITEVLVTDKLNEEISPLPVGKAKPGTFLEIWDEEGNVLTDGEKGEIIILGNTVSSGYFHAPQLTEKAFFQCQREDRTLRGYHTGDKGYLENGMLYYCGRIDLQIKLHGYRIELEDIENNLRKLPSLEHAVVLPNQRGGKISSLTAYVVERNLPEDTKAETLRLKEELSAYLPDYMIPKKFVFLEQMPVTNNGKADRKALEGIR